MINELSWSGAELSAMRIGLALVLLIHLPADIKYSINGAPLGLANIVNLKWFCDPRCYQLIYITSIVVIYLYATGLCITASLAYLSCLFIIIVTVGASRNIVNHGLLIIPLVLLAQTSAYIAMAMGHRWNPLDRSVMRTPDATATAWTLQTILAIYFISGISKLINSRGRWLINASAIPVIIMARSEVLYQDGAISGGTKRWLQRLGGKLGQHKVFCRVFFGAGLWSELCSPMFYYSKKTIAMFGLIMITFHGINYVFMRLPFKSNQMMLLIYCVNIPQLCTHYTP
jgi:hypothetical protein